MLPGRKGGAFTATTAPVQACQDAQNLFKYAAKSLDKAAKLIYTNNVNDKERRAMTAKELIKILKKSSKAQIIVAGNPNFSCGFQVDQSGQWFIVLNPIEAAETSTSSGDVKNEDEM